jgi:protein arginine N-methyltransferase 3
MADSNQVSSPVAEDGISSSNGSETSDFLDLKDDEGWEDAEPGEEQDQIISLLDDKIFPTVSSMLSYCKENYGFDFLQIRDKLSLDFYGSIKLVNYIRSAVKNGQSVSSANITKAHLEDDKFLKPVLEDDALLFNLDDLPPASASGTTADGSLLARVAELEEELRKTQFQFEDYRSVVKKTLDERWNDDTTGCSTSPQKAAEEKRDDDSHYFTSYSYNGMCPRPIRILNIQYLTAYRHP